MNNEEPVNTSEESKKNPALMKKKMQGNMKKIIAVLLALVCVTALSVIVSKGNRKPEESDTPVPEDEAEASPDPVEELSVIALSHHMESGDAGLSIVMYPDLESEPDYNPWEEGMNLTSLPVFRRTPSAAGIPYGLSEEEMRKRLEEYISYFGLETPETAVSKDENETPYSVSASGDGAVISCDGYGNIQLTYKPGFEPSLPEGILLSRNADEESAVNAIQTLHGIYPGLVHSGEWGYDIGGDYDFSGTQIRSYRMYEKGGSAEETILNYNFAPVTFAGGDSGTELWLIRAENYLDACENKGEYPLITYDEAYRQLCEGNYFANTSGITADENTKIADAQLVYLNYRSFEYLFPCWLFYADVTEKAASLITAPEGLRMYGLYYVPALFAQYIHWTDDPVSPSGESPAAVLPEEETELHVDVERITQKETWYCGVTCAQMILRHFGIEASQETLAQQTDTYAPGEKEDGITGTYDSDTARVLNDYLFGGQPQADDDAGYRVQPVSADFDQSEFNTFVTRIKNNIVEGYPSILQIRPDSLYGVNNSGNHNVLVTGFRETRNSLILYLLDPYYGGTQGNGISEIDASAVFTAIVKSVEPSYIW